MGRAVWTAKMRFLLYIALCTVLTQINKTKAKHFLIDVADSPAEFYDGKLPVSKYSTGSDYSDYQNPLENIIKNLIPSSVDEAYDKLIELIPPLKESKEPTIQMFKALEPVLKDLPNVLKNLVETFGEMYRAFVEDKDISEEDAVKWIDAIQKEASPMLKKIKKRIQGCFTPMKGTAWFDVDKMMDGMTLLPDGEIKTAIKDKLKWVQEVLKPIIYIIDEEEEKKE